MTLPSSPSESDFHAPSRQGLAGQLYLFAHALRLSWRAQKLKRGVPLAQLVEQLTASSFLPRRVDPANAWRSTVRSSRRLKTYLNGLDTCLVRSLVVGTLLSDQPKVFLHIGARISDENRDPLQGHSWVSLDERVIPDGSDRHESGEAYREILALPLARRS
jgi:hypothetical protein